MNFTQIVLIFLFFFFCDIGLLCVAWSEGRLPEGGGGHGLGQHAHEPAARLVGHTRASLGRAGWGRVG